MVLFCGARADVKSSNTGRYSVIPTTEPNHFESFWSQKRKARFLESAFESFVRPKLSKINPAHYQIQGELVEKSLPDGYVWISQRSLGLRSHRAICCYTNIWQLSDRKSPSNGHRQKVLDFTTRKFALKQGQGRRSKMASSIHPVLQYEDTAQFTTKRPISELGGSVRKQSRAKKYLLQSRQYTSSWKKDQNLFSSLLLSFSTKVSTVPPWPLHATSYWLGQNSHQLTRDLDSRKLYTILSFGQLFEKEKTAGNAAFLGIYREISVTFGRMADRIIMPHPFRTDKDSLSVAEL